MDFLAYALAYLQLDSCASYRVLPDRIIIVDNTLKQKAVLFSELADMNADIDKAAALRGIEDVQIKRIYMDRVTLIDSNSRKHTILLAELSDTPKPEPEPQEIVIKGWIMK